MKPSLNAKLFIISAPSGGGKSSLVAALLERIGTSHVLERVVTYTSREPRPGEKPGIDYYYISAIEFQKRIEQGFFIEHSLAYGTYYGSPITVFERLAQGVSPVLIVDRVGAECIKAAHQAAVMIWITPPSLEVLAQRLRARNTENEAAIERRLIRAAEELHMEEQKKLYNFYIFNDNFMCALEKLEKIVIKNLKTKIDV